MLSFEIFPLVKILPSQPRAPPPRHAQHRRMSGAPAAALHNVLFFWLRLRYAVNSFAPLASFAVNFKILPTPQPARNPLQISKAGILLLVLIAPLAIAGLCQVIKAGEYLLF